MSASNKHWLRRTVAPGAAITVLTTIVMDDNTTEDNNVFVDIADTMDSNSMDTMDNTFVHGNDIVDNNTVLTTMDRNSMDTMDNTFVHGNDIVDNNTVLTTMDRNSMDTVDANSMKVTVIDPNTVDIKLDPEDDASHVTFFKKDSLEALAANNDNDPLAEDDTYEDDFVTDIHQQEKEFTCRKKSTRREQGPELYDNYTIRATDLMSLSDNEEEEEKEKESIDDDNEDVKYTGTALTNNCNDGRIYKKSVPWNKELSKGSTHYKPEADHALLLSRIHKKRNTGTYWCPVTWCDYSAPRLHYLLGHLNGERHLKVRPFRCTLCPEGERGPWAKAEQLQFHLRRRHKIARSLEEICLRIEVYRKLDLAIGKLGVFTNKTKEGTGVPCIKCDFKGSNKQLKLHYIKEHVTSGKQSSNQLTKPDAEGTPIEHLAKCKRLGIYFICSVPGCTQGRPMIMKLMLDHLHARHLLLRPYHCDQPGCTYRCRNQSFMQKHHLYKHRRHVTLQSIFDRVEEYRGLEKEYCREQWDEKERLRLVGGVKRKKTRREMEREEVVYGHEMLK